MMYRHRTLTVLLTLSLLVWIGGCSGQDSEAPPEFVVGAIPDQKVSELNRRFKRFTDYLETETELNVKYVPSNDYAALVTAFKRGDVHLGWFGGLTGVQARRAVPGSKAIAQRPKDRKFHSKFIVRSDLNVTSLSDLKGLTFTFGDENSTSGHLMPRFYMRQAGINPEKDLGAEPNYSGSHDKTWKLVESGAYQAGALNESVWKRAVRENQVDTSTVEVFYTTPPYYDYNWTIHGDVNERFGNGTVRSVKKALLKLDNNSPDQRRVLELFSADGFVETKNENYKPILETAKTIGIIQ
ncbi:MAG: putative selenate ABC transporter substrate-binding protein [bacterium]